MVATLIIKDRDGLKSKREGNPHVGLNVGDGSDSSQWIFVQSQLLVAGMPCQLDPTISLFHSPPFHLSAINLKTDYFNQYHKHGLTFC